MRRLEIPLTLTLSPKGRGKSCQITLPVKGHGRRTEVTLSSSEQRKSKRVAHLFLFPFKGRRAGARKNPLTPPLPSRERVGVRGQSPKNGVFPAQMGKGSLATML